MTDFTARRTSNGNYVLMADGVNFGKIFINCEGRVTGGSFVDEDVHGCFRRLCLNRAAPSHGYQDYLALARRAFELVKEDREAEARYLSQF